MVDSGILFLMINLTQSLWTGLQSDRLLQNCFSFPLEYPGNLSPSPSLSLSFFLNLTSHASSVSSKVRSTRLMRGTSAEKTPEPIANFSAMKTWSAFPKVDCDNAVFPATFRDSRARSEAAN